MLSPALRQMLQPKGQGAWTRPTLMRRSIRSSASASTRRGTRRTTSSGAMVRAHGSPRRTPTIALRRSPTGGGGAIRRWSSRTCSGMRRWARAMFSCSAQAWWGVVLVQDGLHGGHARGEVPRDGGDGVIRGSHLADAARAPRVDHLPGGLVAKHGGCVEDRHASCEDDEGERRQAAPGAAHLGGSWSDESPRRPPTERAAEGRRRAFSRSERARKYFRGRGLGAGPIVFAQ